MKRILTLSSYLESLNALQDHGPLGSINEMYLNQIRSGLFQTYLYDDCVGKKPPASRTHLVIIIIAP